MTKIGKIGSISLDYASCRKGITGNYKRETELDWTYFCPAPEMHEEIKTRRTGQYRLGLENPVLNEEGRSIISVENVGVVIVDEIEQPKHIKVRFTAAY